MAGENLCYEFIICHLETSLHQPIRTSVTRDWSFCRERQCFSVLANDAIENNLDITKMCNMYKTLQKSHKYYLIRANQTPLYKRGWVDFPNSRNPWRNPVDGVDSSESTKTGKDGSEAEKVKVLRIKLVYLYSLCFVKYCCNYSQIYEWIRILKLDRCCFLEMFVLNDFSCVAGEK